VGSPPRSCDRREAALGEEEEAEDAGRSAAERPAPMEVARTPRASPPSPPKENQGWELFPARQDPVLLVAVRAEQQEAEGDESARLAEELHAIARRAEESAEER